MKTPQVILVVLVALAFASIAPAAEHDTENGFLHVRLQNVWGPDNRGEPRDIDVYWIVKGGKPVSAIATSRKWNQSIHVVEPEAFAIDGRSISGKATITVTPDAWVPKDRQLRVCPVKFQGTLDAKAALTGTYHIVFEGKEISGSLAGGAGAEETGYTDTIWTASLTQILPPDSPRAEEIRIRLGIRDGRRIAWASMGEWMRASRGYEGYRAVPIAIRDAEVTPYRAACKATVPYRLLHLSADPKAMCDVAIEFVRVQGLVGGRARFTLLEDGRPTGRSWPAYGRGVPSGDTPETNPDAHRLWGNKVDLSPWFVPVEGFTPPAPGEHPRLFFRRGDIPALRKRAETEDGKAIVARLRALLAGDGERLPKTFNPTPPANHMKSPDLPVGETFTTWHGEGYGFLYVLTGERKYADLARQCVELAFAGKIDRDNRYGWAHPGTQFRAGSAVTAIAAAYDFCHDAWPADFREQVAREIQDYRKPCNDDATDFVDLKLLAGRTGYPPSSNHYGAHLGVGAALLAILGDPGTDAETLSARLRELEENIPRVLAHGFGDRGFYAEGHHPGRIASNAGLSEFLMALRSAAGRDYITPRPNAQWMALQWVMLLVGDTAFPHHGPYGGDTLDGSGVSHSGDIAFGFGIVEPKYKPALLWTYEHCIKPSRPRYGANTYPHRAVQALLNWPIGAEAANPETVVPKAAVDTIHGFFMCRNRWRDGKDILVTLFKQAGPQGYHRVKSGGVMTIWGLGVRTSWKTRFLGPTEVYEAAADGSMVTSGGGSHLAVDLGGASGAPLMVAALGPAFTGDRIKPVNDAGITTAMTEVKAGENAFRILTLQEGEAPKAVADGAGVKVGGQTVTFDGKRLRLEKWQK